MPSTTLNPNPRDSNDAGAVSDAGVVSRKGAVARAGAVSEAGTPSRSGVRPTTARLRSWIAALGFALVPVVLTAAASAFAQIRGVGDTDSAVAIAGGAGLSAIVGLIVMTTALGRVRGAQSTPTASGFARPHRSREVWWFVPLAVTVITVLVTGGVHVSLQLGLAYSALAVSVAVNEEVWFRGIVVSVLRTSGVRTAIIGSSMMFGVLHLANLAGGENLPAAALQVVFAVLFGFVSAELVILTGSLWPVIIWHFGWDFCSLLGEESSAPLALVGIGFCCALLVVYAAVLWHRIGAAGHRIAL